MAAVVRSVRLTREEDRRLTNVCDAQGVTISEFIRLALDEKLGLRRKVVVRDEGPRSIVALSREDGVGEHPLEGRVVEAREVPEERLLTSGVRRRCVCEVPVGNAVCKGCGLVR